MSQTEQHCACGHPQLARLPVHGLTLEVDTSGLAPAPALSCRERVGQDMHVYIDGNRGESGDGLSPETAVKDVSDAVFALSRYDGCNRHHAYFHLASLESPDATYPEIAVGLGSYTTFGALHIRGESHETTRLCRFNNQVGSLVSLSNISVAYTQTVASWLAIEGKVALRPTPEQSSAFHATWGGCVRFSEDAEIYLYPGEYMAVCATSHGMIGSGERVKFRTLGNINLNSGFALALHCGSIQFPASTDFSGCTAVTGRKYYLEKLSCLCLDAGILPGSVAGEAKNGSVYI